MVHPSVKAPARRLGDTKAAARPSRAARASVPDRPGNPRRRGLASAARTWQPGGARLEHRVRAVAGLELDEDVREVVAHGLGGEAESIGDLGRRRAAGEQVKGLALAVAEL